MSRWITILWAWWIWCLGHDLMRRSNKYVYQDCRIFYVNHTQFPEAKYSIVEHSCKGWCSLRLYHRYKRSEFCIISHWWLSDNCRSILLESLESHIRISELIDVHSLVVGFPLYYCKEYDWCVVNFKEQHDIEILLILSREPRYSWLIFGLMGIASLRKSMFQTEI